MTGDDAASRAGKRERNWRSVSAKADGTRGAVADKLCEAADGLRNHAQTLYGSEGISGAVSDIAIGMADKIDSSAAYIAANDLKRMAADLGTAVKGYPVRSLLVAGLCGFAIGRAFRRG
jgi:hypothetical protein